MTRRVPRRLLLCALTGFGSATLTGCVPPPTPPPEPPPEAPPLPVLGSLAAEVVVEFADPAARMVMVRTPNDSILDVTLPADRRGGPALNAGARLILEYDAQGTARLAVPVRRTDPGRRGRILATIREVERGGRHMTLVDRDGIVQDFALAHAAMMAFATRLRSGDRVAVTIQDR